jgi:hypothetical protein
VPFLPSPKKCERERRNERTKQNLYGFAKEQDATNTHTHTQMLVGCPKKKFVYNKSKIVNSL